MLTRTFRIKTNFNNKLACQRFLHIDEAPTNGIPQSVLDKTIYEGITEDNSHPPVKVKLYDLCRLPLEHVSQTMTWQSHGMTVIEYIDFLLAQGKAITGDTAMAVYFFTKDIAFS